MDDKENKIKNRLYQGELLMHSLIRRRPFPGGQSLIKVTGGGGPTLRFSPRVVNLLKLLPTFLSS